MSNDQKLEVLDAFVALRREVALLRATKTKDLDFGHNQISVLFRLRQSSATMGELAEHTLSDKASVTRSVSLLEKAGFIKRITNPEDRRVVRIKLTAKGREKARQAYQIRCAIGVSLDERLTSSERKQFIALVGKLTKERFSV